MKSRTKAALHALAAAGAAVVLAAGPASAGTDISVHTTDPWQSGTAGFKANGDSVTVCDNRADGMRATAVFVYTGAHISERVKISDTNGSGNSCATKAFDIPEGNRVLLSVCVQNGADGALKYCSDSKEGKA
ncbi:MULTISPECIES: hypothetical protein [unclassified Streptomyces]|uniref:hypothetical protein n=1 Tax=Streptomyces sp. NPDC057412 TaxID=3346123 RepID=UPI00367E1C7D